MPDTTPEVVIPEDDKVHDIREVDGSGDLPAVPEAVEEVSEEASEETEVSEDAAEEAAIQSLRDAATELGYDVSSFEDDSSALTHLVSQARQAEQQKQQLSQYQQLMAAQPKETKQEDPLWNPPEFNPMWLTQVERDDKGNLTPTAGGTPETVQKVLAWAQYRQEQQDKFWTNPYEYMRPYVEKVARDLTSSELESSRETMSAQQLVEKNAEWIYEGDPSDRKFTPDGQLFFNAAQQLPSGTPQQQFDYAMAQVKAVRAERELKKLQSQSQSAETHAQKKRDAVPKPNSSGTLQDVEQNPGLSLKERMMAAMQQHGITSVDLETAT
jgi:hypothetical protein